MFGRLQRDSCTYGRSGPCRPVAVPPRTVPTRSPGGCAEKAPDVVGEVAGVREANGPGDLREGGVGVREQAPCPLDAPLDEVLVWRQPGGTLNGRPKCSGLMCAGGPAGSSARWRRHPCPRAPATPSILLHQPVWGARMQIHQDPLEGSVAPPEQTPDPPPHPLSRAGVSQRGPARCLLGTGTP